LINAIMTSQPSRAWRGHELALRLHVKPRNMLTQLGEWARLGFFTRTGLGTYALNTPTSGTTFAPLVRMEMIRPTCRGRRSPG